MELPARLKGQDEEVVHGLFRRGWKSDVGSTSWNPRFFLGDPKIGGLTGLGSKPNVLIMASNELVPQGLQTGEEE
jgi:hypothetical protein